MDTETYETIKAVANAGDERCNELASLTKDLFELSQEQTKSISFLQNQLTAQANAINALVPMLDVIQNLISEIAAIKAAASK